jgi:hypothetical protein
MKMTVIQAMTANQATTGETPGRRRARGGIERQE